MYDVVTITHKGKKEFGVCGCLMCTSEYVMIKSGEKGMKGECYILVNNKPQGYYSSPASMASLNLRITAQADGSLYS